MHQTRKTRSDEKNKERQRYNQKNLCGVRLLPQSPSPLGSAKESPSQDEEDAGNQGNQTHPKTWLRSTPPLNTPSPLKNCGFQTINTNWMLDLMWV